MSLYNGIVNQNTVGVEDALRGHNGQMYLDDCLFLAVERNRIESTRLLLENRADPNSDIHAKSVLRVAVENGNYAIVKILLEYDAEDTTEDGENNVMRAARDSNKDDIVWALLEGGFAIDGARDIALFANNFGIVNIIDRFIEQRSDPEDPEDDPVVPGWVVDQDGNWVPTDEGDEDHDHEDHGGNWANDDDDDNEDDLENDDDEDDLENDDDEDDNPDDPEDDSDYDEE
jgi:hypothetical protein